MYDPSEKTTVDGPQLSVSRANHEAYTLPHNGRVILVGGTDGNVTLSTTDAFEPWTGKFVRTAPMNTPRAGQATSLLRRGSLIVTGGRNVSGVLGGSEVFGFATVATDKADYHPGDVAAITGTGWKPGEQVQLKISAFPLDSHNLEFTAAATADGSGQFRVAGFNVDKSHIGLALHAACYGQRVAGTDVLHRRRDLGDRGAVQRHLRYRKLPDCSYDQRFHHRAGNICGLPVADVSIKDTRSVDGTSYTSVPGTVLTAQGNGANCSGLPAPNSPRDTSTNGYFSFTFDNSTRPLAPGQSRHHAQLCRLGYIACERGGSCSVQRAAGCANGQRTAVCAVLGNSGRRHH